MIKIIYRDLSPGLHASAQVSGRHTVIALLPGLTPDQRRAALRRIRHSGRMGHGPRVPAMQLALALGLDRIKAAARTGAAVVRLHPAGSTLPVVLLSAGAVGFVLMATVSIHVLPGPTSSNQGPVIGGVTPGPASSAPQVGQGAAPPGAVPGHSGRQHRVPGRLAARQPSSGGSAASNGWPAADTPGGTQFGSVAGQAGTGTGLVTATSAGSRNSAGSGTGTSAGTGGSGSGSSGSGGSGSGSSGTSAGSRGSGSGSGTGTTAGSGTGSGSGTTSGSGGTGSSGSGTGSGSGTTSGSGGTGSAGSGTGSGTGSAGTGSTGSGSSGSGSTGSGSGSGGSGGGLCVTLLVVQACIG